MSVRSLATGWRGSLRRTSMGRRLALVFVAACAFTLVVVAAAFYLFLGPYVLDLQLNRLEAPTIRVAQDAAAFSFGSGQQMSKQDVLPLGDAMLQDLKTLPAGSGILVFRDRVLLWQEGAIVVKSVEGDVLFDEAQRIAPNGPGSGLFRQSKKSPALADVLLAAAPFQFADGRKGLAVVALPASDASSERQGLFRLLLFSGLIAVVVAMLVGLSLGSWLARPLRHLAGSARRMASGAYDQPIATEYPGEVRELAESMETMRHEVRRSEESLRGFAASAAHELRTPLTSIRGFSQALLDGTAATPDDQRESIAAISDESARLERLVNALLTLSRYDSGDYRPRLAATDPGRILSEEVDRLVDVGLVAEGRITVLLDGRPAGGEMVAVTDEDMLRQVAANLLRNAVQYGGDEPIEAEVSVRDGSLRLDVRNGGRPLSSEEASRVFDRFYRGRETAGLPGVGLGLALVKEICELLGGDVQLLTSCDPEVAGPGRCSTAAEAPFATMFRVTLPAR